MQIHFLPVLVCAIISLILGSIWYGPLFGKAWMRIIKADPDCMTDPVKRKEAQKKALPLYILQFVLSIFEIWVLAHFIQGWSDVSPIESSLWIWAAFVMPTVAGASMWSGDSRKDAWQRFWLTAGFQLVLFIVFALVLSAWS